jgi:hypothetical protein
MDALVFGKFTLYEEALHTQFEQTMNEEQAYYYEQQHDNTTSIRFSTIPPPQLVDAARLYQNPILAIPMFAANDVARSRTSRAQFATEFPNRTNVHFINSRRYIDRLGLECGSDDKFTVGSCHEPGNHDGMVPNNTTNTSSSTRNPANMHRCAGPLGGHADLIAWDIIEKLHEVLS